MKTNQSFSWQNELSNNISSPSQLFELGYIDEPTKQKLIATTEQYPMSITRYYLSLIDKKDMSDPIYKMCIASIGEADTDGSSDTSGEDANTVSVGIQHKYKNTVLLLSTNVCAMYCRHCFRKRLVGLTENEVLKFTDNALEYIRNNKEIDNVLISGGDSFLCSNNIIERYLEGLSQIDHVKFIRFGTRTTVVFPQRITQDADLVDILKKYSKQKSIYVVTQFNHPKELTKEATKATTTLRKAGVPVLNQTVLLKDINDNPKTLSHLFNGLVMNGITPYYLFQCRPVKGVKNLFSVPLNNAIDIVDETRSNLSGLAKRFKYAMSHITGKIEILGKDDNNHCYFKHIHPTREDNKPCRIFTKNVKGAVWFSDDLNDIIE